MNGKRQWTHLLVLTTVLALCTVAEAVSTKRIDAVRQKALLNKEAVSYTHLRAPRDLSTSRMPSSA